MSPMGALIMTVFGGLWCTLALINASPTPPIAVVLVVLVTAMLGTAALLAQRRAVPAPEAEQHRVGRLVGRASAAEGLAIPIGIVVLNVLNRGEYIAPMVALIVGLHFLPLAKWLPAPAYYVTAVALVAVAAYGASVSSPGQRNLVVGASAGVVLWLTSAWVLMLAARRRRLASP